MGLFDVVREKVSELLSGAGDKVSDLTGVEVPGAEAADQLAQSGDSVADAAQGVRDDVAGAAQDVTGSVPEAADGAIPEVTDKDR